tara:strand:- start:1871 stop:2011 length:141 start_codon:yes stop_codon:yes gene_type:complete
MESLDFMVRIDDNFYCTECDEENQNEMQKEDESNAHRVIVINSMTD